MPNDWATGMTIPIFKMYDSKNHTTECGLQICKDHNE